MGNLKASQILKIAGAALAVIVVLVFLFRISSSSFSVLTKKGVSGASSEGIMAPAYDMAYGSGGGETALSARNAADSGIIMPPVPGGRTIPGDDAEEYEVTSYDVAIETREKENTCGVFEDLKKKEYIIFENANDHDRGCYFRFKVKNDNVQEVLDVIDSMNPADFSENTYTIKKLVDDFTSEAEILENKKASIEKTLEDAIAAYDDITSIATRTQDAESLAKIIDSKIGIIERLTAKKIDITSQLERLARSKSEQLDRLLYTNFSVSVTEDKYIDVKNLKDSWKIAVKKFVRDINSAIQDVSLNLLASLFSALQYVIYFFIILFAAKYGWGIARKVWRK